jgi:hypothetical protein
MAVAGMKIDPSAFKKSPDTCVCRRKPRHTRTASGGTGFGEAVEVVEAGGLAGDFEALLGWEEAI